MLLECQRGKEEIVGCLPYSSHYENLKKTLIPHQYYLTLELKFTRNTTQHKKI